MVYSTNPDVWRWDVLLRAAFTQHMIRVQLSPPNSSIWTSPWEDLDVLKCVCPPLLWTIYWKCTLWKSSRFLKRFLKALRSWMFLSLKAEYKVFMVLRCQVTEHFQHTPWYKTYHFSQWCIHTHTFPNTCYISPQINVSLSIRYMIWLYFMVAADFSHDCWHKAYLNSKYSAGWIC